MTVPLVSLGECCQVISGATPKTGTPEYWDGEIWWATPKDLSTLTSKFITSTPRTISKIGLKSCAAIELPPGSVLLSSRAPIGHVAINTVPMSTNQGFKSLVPDPDRVDSDYLYYWLRANRQLLENLGNGATFKEISKRTVERVNIPLPPLKVQRRISAVLDRIDTLRDQRRKSLSLLDDLERSTFLNMFGDPASPKTMWNRRRISELGVVTTGNTPSRADPSNYGSVIEWIKSDNIQSNQIYVTTASEHLSKKGATVARIAQTGSVLVTCIAGSPSSIGNAALTDRPVAFNQQINAFTPGEMNSLFALAQFRYGKRLVQAKSSGGMKGLVNKSQFCSIELINPPMDLQVAYSSIAMKIEKQRTQHSSQLKELDALFESTQARAFRGELWETVSG